MSDFSSSVSLRDLVAAVAGPREWSDTRESWLARAARRSGLKYRQVKALFYGEVTDPHHHAARSLRQAAAKLGAGEAATLAAKFETVARAMDASDADFHRAEIAALVDAARALRGLGLPRDDPAA